MTVLLNGTSEERMVNLSSLPLPAGSRIQREVTTDRIITSDERILTLPPHEVIILE